MQAYDFVDLAGQTGEAWLGTPGKPGNFAEVLKGTADFLVEQRSIRSAPAVGAFGSALNTTFLQKAVA
jgi:taurine transport system substrate-binding protein